MTTSLAAFGNASTNHGGHGTRRGGSAVNQRVKTESFNLKISEFLLRRNGPLFRRSSRARCRDGPAKWVRSWNASRKIQSVHSKVEEIQTTVGLALHSFTHHLKKRFRESATVGDENSQSRAMAASQLHASTTTRSMIGVTLILLRRNLELPADHWHLGRQPGSP